MFYGSYGVLVLGLLTDAIVGIELFGVIQLCHISLSVIDYLPVLLSTVRNFVFFHGLNIDLKEEKAMLPARISTLGFHGDFVNNFNLMFGLIVGWILISLGLKLFGSAYPRLYSIGDTMLKRYLLTLVLFTSYNMFFTFGLCIKYGELSALNILLMVLALATVSLVVLLMPAADKNNYKEYYTAFR